MFYFDNDERDVDSVAEDVAEEETYELDDLDEEQGDETDEADDGAEDDGVGEESEEPEGEESAGDDGTAQKEDSFELKYRHETKTLSRKEVIQYAQKGMDYDRIKGEHTALSEEVPSLREFKNAHEAQIAELEAYMQETGAKSIEEVLDTLRVASRVGKGESEELAKANVRAERAERRLKANTAQTDTQSQKSRKAQEDIEAFQKEYPNVKVDEALLKGLSDDLKATGNLTRAYERKQNRELSARVKELEKKLETERQNADGKRRSTGSQKSSGAKGGRVDPLLSALLAED